MKKMRKAKVITALALTVVMMVAMTGIAAAGGIIAATNADGDETHAFNPGEVVYVTGWALSNDDDVNVYVTQNVVWNAGDLITGRSPDIVILVRSASSTEVTNTLFLGTVSNDGGIYDIPYTGDYDVIYDANQNGLYDQGEKVDYITCEGFSTSTIPEFATIAIPVAAIFGLVLFFNHRKWRKE